MGFLEENFIEPILRGGDFNPVNSVTYAAILIVSVYGVYRLVRKFEIKIDKHFFWAIIPFIVLASSTRVLRDVAYGLAYKAAEQTGQLSRFLSVSEPGFNIGLLQQKAFEHLSSSPLPDFILLPLSWIVPFFATPGSYLLTFFLALFIFLFSIAAEKALGKRNIRIPYWKTMLSIGAIAAVISLSVLPYRYPERFFHVTGLTILASVFTYAFLHSLSHYFKKNNRNRLQEAFGILLKKDIQLIMSAHFLDASATFIALKYLGYGEQHPLVEFVTGIFGPESFFLLKAVVVLPILWYIERSDESRDFKGFLKLVILILGLAPGLRDLIRIVVGT
ncbi:MAG: DUF63 family protein [Candidatus Aenigmarchaeota archaeon]|nr:DUF63 family protein [Candidatus Aenigmarchaeota archaeon]